MANDGSLKLTGWPAVIVVLLALGAYGLTFMMNRSALDGEALEPIRLQLQGEYTARLLPDVDPNDPDPAAVDRLLELDQIEFVSVSARGSGESVIVRLEPRVNGQPPPDGRQVRYFKMAYSTLTGWRVRHQSTAFRYYTTLF